jgi:hypothetical protein
MGKMTKAATAEESRFVAEIVAYAKSVGAVPAEYVLPNAFVLPTKAGPMHLIVLDTWVACRFNDVPAGLALVGSFGYNEYSGKWNAHYTLTTRGGSWLKPIPGAVDAAVADFKRRIGPVLPEAEAIRAAR